MDILLKTSGKDLSGGVGHNVPASPFYFSRQFRPMKINPPRKRVFLLVRLTFRAHDNIIIWIEYYFIWEG